MRILAVETSCDETALSLVSAYGGAEALSFTIEKEVVASQVDVHRPWGGVVPTLAKREHEMNLPKLFQEFRDAAPDIVAVTIGPGLEPCLWSGINFVERIHSENFPNSELLGANHLEGHLYSFLLSEKAVNDKFQIPNINKLFPAVALVVSGGHTILAVMRSLTEWEKLGETRDDAVGEAFDKVARMLELPYPGGPEVERVAEKGNPNAVEFPRPMLASGDYDFSYSGLKTAVLYYLRDNKTTNRADVAASFQEAAFAPLVSKVSRAVKEYDAKSVFLSGGVAANRILREKFETKSHQLSTDFYVAPIRYNTDNATMIAVAAYINSISGTKYDVRAQPNLNL